MGRVVFVEDDATIRKLVQVALRSTSHEVHFAVNGREGLELVARTPRRDLHRRRDARDGRTAARRRAPRPEVVVPFTPMFDDAADRGRPLVVLHADNAAAKVMRDLAAQLTVLAPAGR